MTSVDEVLDEIRSTSTTTKEHGILPLDRRGRQALRRQGLTIDDLAELRVRIDSGGAGRKPVADSVVVG